ncbi:MAG: hypothetical protein GX444_20285 [Myxococcales bacterium]|nr:hypothetical protein [Myxococcales bacterium]
MRRVLLALIACCCLLPAAFVRAADDDLAAVERAIAEKKLSWQAGPAYLDPKDFQARLGINGLLNEDPPAPLPIPPVDLPEQFDWRNANGVTDVRNQGPCGSCWAFASIAALESAAVIQGGLPNTIDYSEQYLVSDCYPQYGCGGSYSIWQPIVFLVTNGTVDEECMPYQAQDGPCDLCPDADQHLVGLADRGAVEREVDALKQAVYQRGPVAVTMNVYEDFNYYTSGVYAYAEGAYLGGHAVLVVGYDDNEECFVVKNSWGPGWGEDGFFRISYGEVHGRTRFGSEAEYVFFDTGSYPAGMTPAIDNFRLLDKEGQPFAAPYQVTRDQSITMLFTFDYTDVDGNLEAGVLYATLDGAVYQLGPLWNMEKTGTLGFAFGMLMTDGAHSGSFYVEDTAGNRSNQLPFAFEVVQAEESDDDTADDDATDDDTVGGTDDDASDDDTGGADDDQLGDTPTPEPDESDGDDDDDDHGCA